jgi:hypothetical protein
LQCHGFFPFLILRERFPEVIVRIASFRPFVT